METTCNNDTRSAIASWTEAFRRGGSEYVVAIVSKNSGKPTFRNAAIPLADGCTSDWQRNVN